MKKGHTLRDRSISLSLELLTTVSSISESCRQRQDACLSVVESGVDSVKEVEVEIGVEILKEAEVEAVGVELGSVDPSW